MEAKAGIFLTGATGFLGSHLIERLLDQNYQVIVGKRSSSNLWRIDHLNSRFKTYDLDKRSIESIFTENKIDCVIHLATLYRKEDGIENIREMVDSNIGFPAELLISSIKYGVKGFINTGTYFELDCSKQPVTEGAERKPFNFYASTKLAFDEILKSYSQKICINTMRLFSPFGEKDNEKLVPMIIKSALKGDELQLSEGFQKIDLIYCDDVVSAYMKALDCMINQDFKPQYEDYNIGTGTPLSVRDIVALVQDLVGIEIKVSWGRVASKEHPIAYADINKCWNHLNWKPNIGVRSGLERTLEYYKSKI